MERCIIQKRIEKQNMENYICEYEDQVLNMEEIWELKKQIKEGLEEEIQRLGKSKEMSEGETLVSLGEIDGKGKKREKGRVSIGGISVMSQKSFPALY